MSKLPKDFWIRPLSIGIALSVPSIVVAATVTFSPTTVLSVATMTALSQRTLDKDRVDNIPNSVAVPAGTGESITATCAGTEDIMLNCSCNADSGTRLLDVKTIRVLNNDAPDSLSTCACAANNDATVSVMLIATATCIDLPR